MTTNPIMTAEPGPLDVWVVTLVDGVRVSLAPVATYPAAREKGAAYAAATGHAVKVLPMRTSEVAAMLRRPYQGPPTTLGSWQDVLDRKLIIDTARAVMVEDADVATRRDARDLLLSMGEPA